MRFFFLMEEVQYLLKLHHHYSWNTSTSFGQVTLQSIELDNISNQRLLCHLLPSKTSPPLPTAFGLSQVIILMLKHITQSKTILIKLKSHNSSPFIALRSNLNIQVHYDNPGQKSWDMPIPIPNVWSFCPPSPLQPQQNSCKVDQLFHIAFCGGYFSFLWYTLF